MGSIPNASSVRLVNASVRGADAAKLTAALLHCGSLRTLQLHQVSLQHIIVCSLQAFHTLCGCMIVANQDVCCIQGSVTVMFVRKHCSHSTAHSKPALKSISIAACTKSDSCQALTSRLLLLLALLLLQVIIDERGAVALMQLLDHTPTLQQLDLCR
jgi:hypothetical protein